MKTCDTAIIGAGVLGLWAARHAVNRGEKVLVVEKRCAGAGASGGFLGALMPHMPDSWNAKKQLQLDGLLSLGPSIAALEDDSGQDCGYRRCGRVMPVGNGRLATQIERRSNGAREHWGRDHALELCARPDWLAGEAAPFGVQHDTLSARINPRACINALAEFVRSKAEILEGTGVVSLNPPAGEIVLEDGSRIAAGTIIVANGWEAYPLLQPIMGAMNGGKPIGRGVKGQAVLLEFAHDDTWPVIYHDGTYIVPHSGNRIAVGSTSHNDWKGEPDAFDKADLGFLERAADLVPALQGAPLIGRWAGVRPRNTLDGRGTEPWFGAVPGHDNLIALIGGFKITFGIAHLDHVTQSRATAPNPSQREQFQP